MNNATLAPTAISTVTKPITGQVSLVYAADDDQYKFEDAEDPIE